MASIFIRLYSKGPTLNFSQRQKDGLYEPFVEGSAVTVAYIARIQLVSRKNHVSQEKLPDTFYKALDQFEEIIGRIRNCAKDWKDEADEGERRLIFTDPKDQWIYGEPEGVNFCITCLPWRIFANSVLQQRLRKK